jgi:hypothetical protein
MPICKFCRVGRYEDGYESTSCAFCEELALATDLEYVSKCDGARECAECEVGLIADIKKSVDSPHGYASCTTGYASSEEPNVTLASDRNGSMCYVIKTKSIQDPATKEQANSVRIYWADSFVDLQEKALSQRFVEIKFDLGNPIETERCKVTPNPCKLYLKDPTPKQEEACEQAHAQVIVTSNDPTCGGATVLKGGETRICLAPLDPSTEIRKLPRKKVFISAVIGIFGKLLGERSCGFPGCLPSWETDSCGKDYYLNTTSDNPWTWQCMVSFSRGIHS